MGGGSKVRGAPAANPPPSHSQIFFPDAEILRRAEQLELFGSILSEPKRGRGRPRREFSKQDQCLVRAMLQGGRTSEEIASAIGCSIPTLRAFFELDPDWNKHGFGPKPKRED